MSIIGLAGPASCRSGRLSSNVMPHQIPFTLAVPCSRWQSRRTQSKPRFLIVAIANSCPHRTQASAPRIAYFTAQPRPAATVTRGDCRRSPLNRFIKSAVGSRRQATGLRRWCSPRLAQRAAGPWRSPQRRSTAPALPSAETGWLLRHALRNNQNPFSRNAGVRHNPSLNHRTPNGGPSWPGLRYAVHFRSPGQAVPPPGSG